MASYDEMLNLYAKPKRNIGQNVSNIFTAIGEGASGKSWRPPEDDTAQSLMKAIMLEKIKGEIKQQNLYPNEPIPEGYTTYGGKLVKLPIDSKPSAAAEKRAVEEQKLSDELGGLLNSFGRAKTEAVEKVGGFGKMGLRGRWAGKEAEIKGKAGYLPATNVYNAQRKAFATVVAKAAGEQRPTDEDINRFVETLPDTGKSDEENTLLISDIQEKVNKGGLANLWFTNKNQQLPNVIPMSGQPSEQNIPSFNSEQEAEASGLKGIVMINGKKARID